MTDLVMYLLTMASMELLEELLTTLELLPPHHPHTLGWVLVRPLLLGEAN